MLKGFREFIMRGNVVDLAVAVVMGAAFGAVVASLVANVITPLIAAIFGKPDLSVLTLTINGSVIAYGSFLNAVIGFLLVAVAVYFFIVAPMNTLKKLTTRDTPSAPSTRPCPECLSNIPAGARRCAFCTSAVSA